MIDSFISPLKSLESGCDAGMVRRIRRGRKESMHDTKYSALSARLSAHDLITTTDHPDIRRFAALRDRAERDRTGQFQIEGIRSIIQAAEQEFPFHSVLLSPLSPFWQPSSAKLARELLARGAVVHVVTPNVLHAIANNEDPQGIVAITSKRVLPLDGVTPSSGTCWLAVDSIQSAGNLGSLLRTSECVGGAGVIVLGESVEPYDPGCVRASMGAIFNQRIVFATFDDLRLWARRHRGVIVGTSPSARVEYRDVDFRHPSIIMLGCEKKGLAKERQLACDITVRIPMSPSSRSDSLNVAVAGSLLLYEAFSQQRSRAPHHPGTSRANGRR